MVRERRGDPQGRALSRAAVKVGFLLPRTGVDSAQGADAARGFELGLERLGRRAGGREIRIVREDDQAKPEVALPALRRLVEEQKVDFILGPISSAVVLAIRDYVHQQSVPLLVPAAFTRVLTAPQNASPSIFRLSETSDQANYPMGAWMMKNTPHRRMVVFAADFAGGRHSVEAFMAGYRAAGGEIAAQIYPPFACADYGRYIDEAASVRADAVYAWFAGADAVHFLTQYHASGGLPVTGHSALTADTILPAIGKAALGVVSVGAYTAALRTQANLDFVRVYEGAYGTWPSRYSECGWTAAALIAGALEALAGDLTDAAKVREALAAALPKVRAPRGAMRFDAWGQAVTPVYVTRTEQAGGRYVNTVLDEIPAVSQEATWGWWRG